MPAFRVRGKVVAGFAAFKNHLSYLPHSGSVLSELADEIAGMTASKGALRFPVDSPLPKGLVGRLVEVRLSQAFGDGTAEPRRKGRSLRADTPTRRPDTEA
jgi:uncharacterized protein YdhG (YjbR/CyaY superfamily)